MTDQWLMIGVGVLMVGLVLFWPVWIRSEARRQKRHDPQAAAGYPHRKVGR